MTIPPAHRRLVPRGPKGPRGPSEPPDPDDFEETTERPKLDPAELHEDEAGPDPASSLEMTARRPMLEPEDALDVELTLETRALDQSADDSFHQMTVERVRPISQPGDELLDEPQVRLPTEEDEPPPLDKAPSAPRFSESIMRGVGDGDFLHEHTGFDRESDSGVEDRAMAQVSPAEFGLLAAMSEGHEPSRLVYADWLERRGEVTRAEFLRLDHALVTMSPHDDRFTRTLVRLREVAPRVSVDWRSRVARSSIEGCTAGGAGCPGEWRRLPADRDDVRTCGACGGAVYYCATIQLAQELIEQGQRVAIDITCNRWPGDLGEQCASCRGHIPPDTRFCPHCGRPIAG